MWVFGYGSIIWKPGFAYDESRSGVVRGWDRRFWQHSPDHRGVPGDPGRVVTMVESEAARCWGRAFRVAEDEVHGEVVDQLDEREQGGYRRLELTVRSPDSGEAMFEAVAYVATPENEHWGGSAPVDEIAEQVVHAEGPSGTNVEYVLELAEALREMGAVDEHVFAVEEAVRERLG